MQSSTPQGQFYAQIPHPKHSVHALKLLFKILPFGSPGRKPSKASRRVPRQAWSTAVKYPCLGLIAAKSGRFSKKPYVNGWDVRGGLSAGNAVSGQLAADIEKFLPALVANHVGVEVAQVVQRLLDRIAGGGDHGGGIAMRTAGGFL